MENAPDDGFEEIDHGVGARLKNHTTGANRRETPQCAPMLRKLSAGVEPLALYTGYAPILGTECEKVGELYLDFYGKG